MRLFISLAVAVAAAFLLAGCNSAQRTAAGPTAAKTSSPAASPQVNDGVRRITPAQLQDMINKGSAFVVDVRTEAAYKQAHIPGAVLIPTNEVLNRLKEFPRDKTIVTYCS